MATTRTATITLKTNDGKATATVKISQGAADLIFTIDKYEFSVESEGGEIQLKVTHNVDYTVSQPDWVSLITKTTDGNTDTLSFYVSRNPDFKREGYLVLDNYKGCRYINIKQLGSKKNGGNDDTTTGGKITLE